MTEKIVELDGNKPKKSRRKRIIWYVGGLSLVAAIAGYVLLSFYFQNHFTWNTRINGISVDAMSVEQAKKAINVQVDTYILTLEERDGMSEAIIGENIGLHTVFGNQLENYMEEQNGFAWPFYALQKQKLDIDTSIEYDETMLTDQFETLGCLDETKSKPPVDAHVSEYGSEGYVVIPEEPGSTVVKEKLYSAIQTAIANLSHTLSLDEAGCYLEVKITQDDPRLLQAVEQMNRIAKAKITYQFGDQTEVLDGDRMNGWLVLGEDYSVELDPAKVKEFVDYIGKTYNSFGRERSFQTSYGKTITVRGGDYGWWLNRGKEVKELTKLILEGKETERTPAYFQTAQQYGTDDIGSTYVEVNLTAQHLFFYKEGVLVMETDFVSGNVSKKLGTPVGTYPVQYKESDAVLVGEDYASPVKYWMPFNGNIGFHDAPWRDEFGKDIYLTNGSHGCINMPPKAAKRMFQDMQRGVAVVVYRLKGTENYDTDPKKASDKTSKK